ncbi:hypothetical protein PHJA_002697500, partial [Phtheirospermum japonicum]
MNESTKDRFHEADARIEESESLSDIDDIEKESTVESKRKYWQLDLYLHSEEEKKLKKNIWEEMNKEYLEEQAVKEAAALAAKKAYGAAFANCSGDVEAAQRLAAAVAEAVAKSKKEKQQKRAAGLKNMGAAQTTHEAAKQALDRKVDHYGLSLIHEHDFDIEAGKTQWTPRKAEQKQNRIMMTNTRTIAKTILKQAGARRSCCSSGFKVGITKEKTIKIKNTKSKYKSKQGYGSGIKFRISDSIPVSDAYVGYSDTTKIMENSTIVEDMEEINTIAENTDT